MKLFNSIQLSAGRPLLMLAMAVTLVLSGCRDEEVIVDDTDLKKPQEYNYELALQWNELVLEIERFTPGYRPPVSGRALGYIGLAAYESILPGMSDEYNSLEDEFGGLVLPKAVSGDAYHWPTVLTACYAKSLELFFPTAPSEQLFKVFRLRNELFLEYKNALDPEIFDRSSDFGRQVAQAVYNWSATDQIGHQAYLRNTVASYQPPQGPGLWQPTYPDYSQALLPYWGEVRSFVADESDITPAPLAYSEQPGSPIYQQALEARNKVTQINQGQLGEDKWIADFWSDDCPILTFTPAARWIAVANQVIEREETSLALAIETYARVGMALCDAGIRAWHEKYRWNYLRPIDYIRDVQNDPNWNTVMCPDGSGNYFTPPFPAYPSGHATFSAVAAEVLTDLYGEGYDFVDRCHEGRTEFDGRPRTFNDFYEMAEENGYSRIPLGVHFKMDSDAGLNLGYRIGRKVNELPWRK